MHKLGQDVFLAMGELNEFQMFVEKVDLPGRIADDDHSLQSVLVRIILTR